MRALITGADGFLGRHLCNWFQSRGWEVAGLVRDPRKKGLDGTGMRYYHFAFPDELDTAAFAEQADVLIHAAFDMRPIHDAAAYAKNGEAAAVLLERAREHGVSLVFISSMSAHERAESRYGREKLRIERMLDLDRDLAIRPGFIIGEGGVFASLARTLKKLPAVPLFYGGMQPIHTIWCDDLCAGIETAVTARIKGLLVVGERAPVTIREFYESILECAGLSKPALAVPGTPALWLLQSMESMGLRLPLSSDNLLGLKRLKSYDVGPDLERLKLSPRPMRESLELVDWRSIFA